MEMLAAPPEGYLQRSVEVGNAAVTSNEQAAPDQRADAAQDDAQLVHDGFGGHVRFRHAAIVRLPIPSLPPTVCPTLQHAVQRQVPGTGGGLILHEHDDRL